MVRVRARLLQNDRVQATLERQVSSRRIRQAGGVSKALPLGRPRPPTNRHIHLRRFRCCIEWKVVHLHRVVVHLAVGKRKTGDDMVASLYLFR
jgi:hypothetical protein